MNDGLSPSVREFVRVLSDNFPALGTDVVDAAHARALLAAAPRCEPQPLPRVEDMVIDPAGLGHDVPPLRVRGYWPALGVADAPALVFLHGGGFVLCDLDSHDAICRDLAMRCQTVVLSVDYRRAPEHPFPAAALDAYAATCWVHEHATELGIDQERISVAGDSAGGNLAAVTALQCRDLGGPSLRSQTLLYPMLDPRQDSASYRSRADGYFVTAAHLRWYWACYRGAEPGRPTSYLAPLRANSLARLPSALVVVAGCDPLHDEGREYAARLDGDGTGTVLLDYPGLFHGFFGFGEQLPEVAVAVDETTAAMRALV